MNIRKVYTLVNWLIAATWFANGLFCKILNLVPRHQQIVARILGEQHSTFITKIIGSAEIMIGLWIIAGIWPRLNIITQIAVIAIMNILEFLLVPDLLLWGRMNAVFAFLLILIISFNEFNLRKKSMLSE